MSNDQDSRREEIIRLQHEIIRQMTGKNLERVGEDLFGEGSDMIQPWRRFAFTCWRAHRAY